MSLPRRPFLKSTESLDADLLQEWCDGLLKLQINDPARPEFHGAFRCPACNRLHGRCGGAVYPLLHLARTSGKGRYLDAAIRVAEWTRNVDAPDGSWTNEPHSPKSWKGTTIFGAIALAEALRRHGELLEPAVKGHWLRRLRAAAQWVYDTLRIDYGNINYPAAASYGLTLLGDILNEPKYRARGRELAHLSVERFSEPNQLLIGEGQPQTRRSPNGLLPIDLGYNVEESLPALALYGLATQDEPVLFVVTAALASHLDFMLPDGAWDNSWGTRSYKWTYWGSRTTEGCQPAYALLAGRNPAFATAAYRNAQLLRACTHDGLLHGGPHLAAHGLPPCVHHTFCHSKAFATVLDHGVSLREGATLPRETSQGTRHVVELNSSLLAQGPWRATVSGYDWLYRKGAYQAMGGALSLLWHEHFGPLLSASLAHYVLPEPNNMQPLLNSPDFCLTPRIETRIQGRWYTNLFYGTATLSRKSTADDLTCTAATKLVDANGNDCPSGTAACQLTYRLTDTAAIIGARVSGEGSHSGEFHLVLPVISENRERVRRISSTAFEIEKAGGAIVIDANAPLTIVDTGGERVFNLIPGFQAIPFAVRFDPTKSTDVSCALRPRLDKTTTLPLKLNPAKGSASP